MASEAQRLYKLAQVSEMLGVSIPTLRTWERRGMIAFVRLPSGTVRITDREVERIMTGGEAWAVQS